MVAASLAFLVPPPKAWRPFAVVAVMAACFCTGPLVTRLVGANRGYTEQAVFLFDLAGLSLAEGRDLLPPAFEGPGQMSMERLRELYREDDIQLLAWPGTPGPHLLFSPPPEEVRKLPGLWVRAIARHPLVYLRHRWHLFMALLGLRIPQHYGPPFPQGIDANNLGLRMEVSRWRGVVVRGLDHLEESFFFHGWTYVALSLAVLGVAIRRASVHRRLIAALAASSLANVLPYFVIGPTHHFRFVLWTVAAGLLSLLLAASTLNRGRVPIDLSADRARHLSE